MVRRPSLNALGVCVWTLCTLSIAASAQSSLAVAWTGARLTVSAANVPFAAVLHEVARQTGVQFVGAEVLTHAFSIELTDTSLEDGLRQLLADVDHVMALPQPAAAPPAVPARVFVFRRIESSGALPEIGGPEPMLEDPETEAPAASESPDDVRDPELRRLEESGFFDQASAGALVDASHHAHAAVRVRALEVLSQRDAALSAEVAGNALTDADPSVSSAAAALIAENADPRAVERLGLLLKNDDPAVRFGAIQLLAQRGDAASLPYARQAANDANPAVRMVARQLVERLQQMRSGQ